MTLDQLKATKSKVVFANAEFGGVYVPAHIVEKLQQAAYEESPYGLAPRRLRLTLELVD